MAQQTTLGAPPLASGGPDGCVRGALLMLLLLAVAAAPGYAAVAGTLALEDCRVRAGPGFPGVKARCGSLPRPLDPLDPESGVIELFVAVVPALSLEPEADPFVPIAGGPGQASSEFYAAYTGAFEYIRRSRDILLLDQRGTGRSARLDCEVGDSVLDGSVSPDETRLAARQCLEQLEHDPRYFTTSVAVTDLEALRQALGYPRLNLYGASYGTRVAQHYLRRYPEATRTVILDGVVPPQLALGPAIALEAQRALDGIFARCDHSAPCSERFPDIARTFGELKARLAAEAVAVDVADPLTGAPVTLAFGAAELAGALRILSYHPNTVALVPLLVQEAANGNLGPLASQYLMAGQSLADALSIGMHNAVVCTEDAPFFEAESVDRDALDSTYIGPVQLDSLAAICAEWPEGLRDADLRKPLATDAPVLLLSGDADPITPPAFADMAAGGLANSRHLVGENQGHGQAPRTCIPEIMADFVNAADPSAIDEDCLVERQFAMPFFLDFLGPSP